MKRRRALSSAEISQRIDSIDPAVARGLVSGTVVTRSDFHVHAGNRARAAYEHLQGAPFTDAEWEDAQSNLDALMLIAIRWQGNPLP